LTFDPLRARLALKPLNPGLTLNPLRPRLTLDALRAGLTLDSLRADPFDSLLPALRQAVALRASLLANLRPLGADALLAALAGSRLNLGAAYLAVSAPLRMLPAIGAVTLRFGLRRRRDGESSDGCDQKALGHQNVVRCCNCIRN
jgi:hypothetical protein